LSLNFPFNVCDESNIFLYGPIYGYLMLRHQNIFKARKGVVLQIKYKLGKQLGPDGDGLPMFNNLWDCFHSTKDPMQPPLCLSILCTLL